ncbi:hypothetical protein POM88_033106 [Heracleum sosnowskyi]|uniref:Ubiquitin-like protease family profile domain-containing protein n=1 Tax=Heracleum sosnowskyi TaxID=360622 RepID=A0AAD8I1H8_9APIA|nr:hypothetical protein POM88_033106 [Heracleum sosnowskyi]
MYEYSSRSPFHQYEIFRRTLPYSRSILEYVKESTRRLLDKAFEVTVRFKYLSKKKLIPDEDQEKFKAKYAKKTFHMLIEELMESKDLEEANMNFKEAASSKSFDSINSSINIWKVFLAYLALNFSWSSSGINFFLDRYLKRTVTSKALSRSLLVGYFTYSKIEREYDKFLLKSSYWWKGDLDEYSYIILPISFDHHFSLAIVCFIAGREKDVQF